MTEPVHSTIRRVALFLFISSLVICGLVWRAASGFQGPEQQAGVW